MASQQHPTALEEQCPQCTSPTFQGTCKGLFSLYEGTGSGLPALAEKQISQCSPAQFLLLLHIQMKGGMKGETELASGDEAPEDPVKAARDFFFIYYCKAEYNCQGFS